MNSPTITMEKEAALAKLEEYERAAEKNPHAVGRTEKAILQGYRAMHSGRTGRIVVGITPENGGSMSDLHPHPLYPSVLIRGTYDPAALADAERRAARDDARTGPAMHAEFRSYAEPLAAIEHTPQHGGGRPPKTVYSDWPGEGPWRSLDEAAEALGRDRSTVHHAVKWGTRCAGRRLSYSPFRAVEMAA